MCHSTQTVKEWLHLMLNDHVAIDKVCGKYSATGQESRFLPLCGFCSVFRLNLHVSLSNLISS